MYRCFALLVFFLAPSVCADWTVQEEHWYSVTIDGVKSGWAHEVVEVEGETGDLKTEKMQTMTLSRGGMELTIAVTTSFIESAEGKPISVSSTQEAMGSSQTTSWKFVDGTIEMTTAAGGQPIVKKVPLPKEPWLTPQAVKRLFMKKMNESVSAITYQTMSPELGPAVITVVMTKKGETTQDVLGKEVSVTVWETVNDKMPVIGTEWYSHDGTNVGSSINAGFGAIENRLMPKHDALSPVNEVPELMVSLLVEPNLPIDIEETKLTMLVKSKDGSSIELPSVGMQHVSGNNDGTATVVVDLENPIEATEQELQDPHYLEASALCDGTDEAVVAIAQDVLSAMPDGSSDMDKALALRAKVFYFIEEKDMSTAFASASQTARSKRGDCSEHAVLLCGLLRASGIPSRGVMGMVYLPERYVPEIGGPNGAFGWHMWSQALIDGKWIDLDATLPVPFTVGHITTLTSSLADEDFATEMGGILPTIGNLKVDVLAEDEVE